MSIWIKGIIVIVIMTMLAGLGRFIYKAGWNSRDAQVMKELLVEQERVRAEEKIKWQALVDAAEATIVVEEKIVEQIRFVEKKVPQVVEKIVEVKSECRDLGPDYAGLLNDYIAAANNLPAANPAEPVD